MKTDCELFQGRLQAVLDNEAPMSVLADHAERCATCRADALAAKHLSAYRSPVPAVPAGFAERIVARVGVERRADTRRRVLQVSAIAALAASLLVGISVLRPPPPTPLSPDPAPITAAAPGVMKPLNEAREALVALTARAAGDTLKPAKNLLFAEVKSSDPPADALSQVPEAALAGVEPLVSTPRRALNLFVRDLSNAAIPRKSD